MAALLSSASSQYLSNSAPFITGYPFSLGMWLNPAGSLLSTPFTLADLGTAAHHHRIRVQSSGNMSAVVAAGGAESSAVAVGALSLGLWTFFVARFISSANRKISALVSDGSIVVGSSTASVAPNTSTAMTIGALNKNEGISEYFNGRMAEFWITNSDIQPDGAALAEATLRQLAYGGPFSVPHIVKDIVEYRSFRVSPTRAQVGEVFGRQTWDNINGVSVGAQPPLPYWFQKPSQNRRLLIV